MSSDDGGASAPFDSLYDLPPLQDETAIGIERGSELNSFVDQRLNNLTLKAYGAGDPPLLNLRDRLDAGAWSQVDGTANTYQQSVPAPSTLSGSYTPRLWEDTTELPSKDAVTSVDATPGSFHVAEGTDTWTVSYHPTNSGDPTTNDRPVYWAARPTAYVGTVGRREGGLCEGLHIAHPLSNAGCVQMGPGGTVRRCLLRDGGKHNLVHAGGRIEDVVCVGSAPANVRSPLAQSAISWFQNHHVTTPQDIVERNFIIVGTNGLASLGHTNGAGFNQADVKGHVEIDTAFGGSWPGGAVVEGLYTRNSGTAPDADIIRYAQLDGKKRQSNGGNDAGIVVEDSVLFYQALTRNINPGATIVLRNCVVFSKERTILTNIGGASYDLTLENCALFRLGARGIGGEEATISGDRCVFFSSHPSHEISLGGKTTLSDLQSATGSFANSVWLTSPQFRTFFRNGTTGWLRGDVRISPKADVTTASGTVRKGTLPDDTPVTDVGPQTHWDWARGEPAPGAPTQWPTPPETEDEGKTYISAPANWDWTQSPPTYLDTVDDVLAAAYEMDQEAGPEPDRVAQNDAFVAAGDPGQTNSPFGPARTFDGSSYLKTDDLILTDTSAGVLISVPIQVSSVSASRILSSRQGRSGYELRLESDGTLSVRFTYARDFTASAKTPSQYITTDTWHLVQAWLDIKRGQAGIRVDDAEYQTPTGLLRGLRNSSDTTAFGARRNGRAKFEGALGRFLFWNVSPSKADRDWLYNDGDYRTLLEVQSYSVTLPDL